MITVFKEIGLIVDSNGVSVMVGVLNFGVTGGWKTKR